MIEAFSRMLVKRPRLRKGGFKPYIYKVAHNLALRHIKMRSRFMSVDVLGAELASGERIEDGVLQDERARALYRCLEKIAPDYREALYLVYIRSASASMPRAWS